MGNLSNLPTDIILDILTRLPAESILECKLVCRPWRSLVSHHPFYQLYLNRLNNSDESGKFSLFVRDFNDNEQLHYFEFIENNDERPPIHRTRRINLTLPFKESYYVLTGSSNGLVCIYVWFSYYFICNPVTREYVILPNYERDFDDTYSHCSSGFGYLPLTNEYKVVALYELKKEPKIIEVAVYTLGSRKGWRNVGRLDTEFGDISKNYGVFVNGALHWLDKRVQRVFVFDLSDEKFDKPVSLPLLSLDRTKCDYFLGVLGGVLYFAIIIIYDTETTELIVTDIWLLKEKNDGPDMKEKVKHKPLDWNKEFSLPGISQPLAFTKIGGVLCYVNVCLSIYDPITSTSEDLLDIIPFYEMMSYKNSLVSLTELGEEDVYVMETAEIEETEADEIPGVALVLQNRWRGVSTRTMYVEPAETL